MLIIYLISILSKIRIISELGLIAGVSVLFGTTLGLLVCDWGELTENEKGQIKQVKKARKWSIICTSIFAPIVLFMPNDKEIATIFAVGTTIEYVKNNEKIKELPDKAILCLDKFIDEYLKENTDK